MVSLARKNLLHNRARFLITVIGVAFSIMLIAFQLAILVGIYQQITTYIDNAGGKLWAMQKDVNDLASFSLVPKDAGDKINKIEGVKKATGIYIFYTSIKIKNGKTFVYLVGYDAKTGKGGPWKLGEKATGFNTRKLQPNEVVIEESLAKNKGLNVGDQIWILGNMFIIKAFSQETNSIGSQYIFISKTKAAQIIPGGESSYTHYMVDLEPDSNMKKMIAEINKIKGIEGVSADDFAKNTLEYLGAFIVPLMAGGVVIGFLVGLVIIGLTVYNSVLEKVKEYGVVKAMGGSNWFINRIVIKQVLISGILGYLLGLALTMVATKLLNNYVPGMNSYLDFNSHVSILIMVFFMSLFSSFLPIRRLKKVDPVDIFRT